MAVRIEREGAVATWSSTARSGATPWTRRLRASWPSGKSFEGAQRFAEVPAVTAPPPRERTLTHA